MDDIAATDTNSLTRDTPERLDEAVFLIQVVSGTEHQQTT